MPPPDPTPLPPDDTGEPDEDDLVAYLDGELAEPDVRSVESKLALDPVVRAKADAYKRTYDLLDYLPRPEPSPDFTARTLTRLRPAVAGSGSADVRPTGRTRGGRVRAVARVVFFASALASGFAVQAGVRAALGPPRVDPDTLPLSDLRVIERLPLYLGVDDIAFVRALAEPGLFGHTERAGGPAGRPDQTAEERDELIRLFLSYPPDRRQQLRALDEALTALPPADQDRLFRVLEAYAVWLDRLPDGDRTAVLAAHDAVARVEVVRQTRERLWRDALPTRRQDQLKLTADAEEAVRLVGHWKAAEDARAEEWAIARRLWADLHQGGDARPWPFGQPVLARGVDDFVRTALHADLPTPADGRFDIPPDCRLDRGEFLELKLRREAAEAEGYWLLYGACVYRLAERHPYLPPPAAGKPVTDWQQLPKEVAKQLRAKKGAKDLGRVRGQWPEFALEVVDNVATDKLDFDVPLGPARPGEFAPPLRAFVEQTLAPMLSPDQAADLAALEGQWPAYPRRLVELAREYDLAVPGVTLPGQPSRWRKYYGPAGTEE